jgi:hypothetical protein
MKLTMLKPQVRAASSNLTMVDTPRPDVVDGPAYRTGTAFVRAIVACARSASVKVA